MPPHLKGDAHLSGNENGGSLGRLVMSPAGCPICFWWQVLVWESGASGTSTTGTRHRSWAQNEKKNEYATTRSLLTSSNGRASVALWYFSFRVRRPSLFCFSPAEIDFCIRTERRTETRRQQESGATWGGKEGKEGAWAIAKGESRERQGDKEKEGRQERKKYEFNITGRTDHYRPPLLSDDGRNETNNARLHSAVADIFS